MPVLRALGPQGDAVCGRNATEDRRVLSDVTGPSRHLLGRGRAPKLLPMRHTMQEGNQSGERLLHNAVAAFPGGVLR